MKIEVTDLSPVKKTLSVEADPDEVAQETEAVVRRYAGQARIPGFRPGKAPIEVIRRRFAKEIQEDVRDRLISRLYSSATREKGLRPIGDPVLEDLNHDPGTAFRFKTTFEVFPELTPKSYRGIEARRVAAKVAPNEIDESLESLRQANARYTAEDGRAALAGDLVVADVEEHPEGAEAKRRERATIEIGIPEQRPEFNERLTGVTPGADVEFDIAYPAEHPSPAIAGKSVRYRLHVHEVKRRDVPELDDEFARDLGDFEDLAALRERIRKDLQERKESESRQAVRQSILDKVLLENPVALPEVLVDEEVQQRLEDMVRSMMLHGMDPRKAELDWKELRDRQVDPARKVVHARLVLDAIAVQESLKVEDPEIQERLRREATRIGETYESLRARLAKGGGLEALHIQMLREKSLDFLTSVANIQDVE